MSRSIKYYNENANSFFDRAINANMVNVYKKFLPLLPDKGHILDLGCGIGRDSKYFKMQECKVTAIDGSEEMVKVASEYIGQDVLFLNYDNLSFQNKFDGVWACASLFHVPYEDLNSVIKKIHGSLKENGIFYASFKYGDKKRTVGTRDFYDMNEDLIALYINEFFHSIKIWKTSDAQNQKASDPSKAWLNILCRKKI